MKQFTDFVGSQISNLIGNVGGDETVTVTRTSGLKAAVRGGLEIVVRSPAIIGATSVTVGQTGAERELLAGSVVSFQGNAAEYTTTATAVADSAGDLDLVLTSGLVAAISVDDAVELVSKSVEYTYVRMRDEIVTGYGKAPGIDGDRRYHLSARNYTVEPEVGDLLTDEQGRQERISKVVPLAPGAKPLCWTVHTGGSS